MRKLLIVIGIIPIILVTLFFAFNSYIYNKKQNKGLENVEPYKGTLTGEYVCLPHRNTSGPQTLECALGMKTDADEYYALDFNLLPQDAMTLKTGDRFTATGTITPIERLSMDSWQKYNIRGILSITDPVQKL